MDESERLGRFYENVGYSENKEYAIKFDSNYSERIFKLLNDPRLDKYSMVDAYYYDYSVIPYVILDKYNFYSDQYLIFGITNEAEIISKWVDRYDLDSNDPIVDGKVIHSEIKPSSGPPLIPLKYSSDLLSHPIPNLGYFNNNTV